MFQLPRDVSTPRGKQLGRTVRGTKREARRALAALVTEVSTGKISSSTMSLADLLERWLDHVSEQLSPTTVREYRRLVKKLISPDLGKLTLRQVSTQRLDTYYATLARERGLSPASVRHVHAVMRGALGQAVRWGWIPTNPLPWLAAHPTAEWVGEQLRLGKRPITWHNRSLGWPAWNVSDRRAARFWSATNGLDETVVDAVRSGIPVNVVEPSRQELVAQLGVELSISSSHLQLASPIRSRRLLGSRLAPGPARRHEP